MSVFISHSFDDDARFDDLCHALELQRISFWQPKAMRGGASLRNQLRAAISDCDLCVFLATKNSVDSSWCSAELGAFWGANKKVIVYVADESLTDDDIPEQFKGDLWYRRVREVAREAKQTLSEAASARKTVQQTDDAETRVGDLSVGALLELLRTSLLSNERSSLYSETLDRLAVLVDSKVDYTSKPSSDLTASFTPHLDLLIGESIELVKAHGAGAWEHAFGLSTSTGYWVGFASKNSFDAGGDVELNHGCLLMRLKGGHIESAIVVAHANEIGVNDPTTYSVGPVLARAGECLPGETTGLETFKIMDNASSTNV